MACYYNGELEILSGMEADETVRNILKAHDLFGPNATGAAVRCIGNWIEFDDLGAGDITDDLEAAVHELYEAGYRTEGTITYYGDYDGGYEISENGELSVYSEEDWIIHNAGDDDLIYELRRRGYTVNKADGTRQESA